MSHGRLPNFGRVRLCAEPTRISVMFGSTTVLKGYRMMEQPGSSKMNSFGKPRDWFEDIRDTHEHQAEYLLKLARLRENLINQEHTNLLNAIERVYSDSCGKNKCCLSSERHRGDAQEQFPARHIRLKQEKIARIEKLRRGKIQPYIETLEGKKLIESTETSPKSNPKRSDAEQLLPRISEENLNKLISSHAGRQVSMQKLLQPTEPSRSIPNIGRKAITQQPQKLLQTNEHQESVSESCIKQLPVLRKDPKNPGLFSRIHTRHVGNKSKSAVFTVSPNTFGIDSYLERRDQSLLENACKAPIPSPEPWSRRAFSEPLNTNNLPNSIRSRIQNAKYFASPADVTGEYRLRNQRIFKKRITSHMTSSKHSLKVNNPFVPKRSNTNNLIQMVANENIQSQQSIQREHQSQERDISSDSSRDSVLFVPNKNMSRESYKKLELTLSLPNVELRTPTPSLTQETTTEPPHQISSLQKAYKQNELRDKEIHRLLEDVRELNQVSNEMSKSVLASLDN